MESSLGTVPAADYISNRRLLLSLADAGGRLMLSWKDLSELAGSTSRVYTLLSTLHDLSSDNYASLPRPADLAPGKPFYDLGALNGRLVDDAPVSEGVSFDKVPIVAPAPGVAQGGEELVKQLSVRVKPGEHLLITGGNGSGKTAIARVLAGASHARHTAFARCSDASNYPQVSGPFLRVSSRARTTRTSCSCRSVRTSRAVACVTSALLDLLSAA